MTTYANLKAFIAGFAHRTDLNEDTTGSGITELDFFLQLAHNDIEQALDWQYMEAAETLTDTDFANVEGQIYEADLGADIFQIRSVNVNGVDIQFYEPGVLRERFGNAASGGVAAAWSVVANKLWIAPGLGSVLMVVRRRTPPMSQPNEENDIAKYYPNLYLYGSLVHLHRYVQDTEEEQKAVALFNEEMRKANERAGLIRSGSTPAMVAV